MGRMGRMGRRRNLLDWLVCRQTEVSFCNCYLFIVFFRNFENGSVASPLPCWAKAKARSPRFSTMLQATGLDNSMFPVWRALPQRELCAFILLKLNTKAFQTPGLFFHAFNTASLLECGEGRELEVETGQNILSEKQILIGQSCLFCVSPADLQQISIKESHIYAAACVSLLRGHSAPSQDRRGYFHLQLLQIQMQGALEAMPFVRVVWRKKHNLSLLVDYSPIKSATESQMSSEQTKTSWKDVWLLNVLS